MLPFTVPFDSNEPAYEQVVFAAKKAIITGLLRPGDRFPSVRQMSMELRINPNTAQKATAALVEAGLLEVRPGIETVVRESPTMKASEKRRWIEESVSRLLVEAMTRGIQAAEITQAIDITSKKLNPASNSR